MERFEYALREENRLLFHKMLSEGCKKEKIVDFIDNWRVAGRDSTARTVWAQLWLTLTIKTFYLSSDPSDLF
jgi:hypothetical protein